MLYSKAKLLKILRKRCEMIHKKRIQKSDANDLLIDVKYDPLTDEHLIGRILGDAEEEKGNGLPCDCRCEGNAWVRVVEQNRGARSAEKV